jgi:RNA polymerase sigma-70 factor (ECF subfamily)
VHDDAELIDRALGGDATAFGHLVTKYQDRLYNTLVHVVHCHETARDIAQDALVQAYVKLETFQRSSAFYTWLYRIAFNLAVSRGRRERRLMSIERAHEATGQEPADRGAEPGARLEQRERAAQVQAALATLSDEHRSILVLREIDGCSYEQIAEILNLPLGTIRSRLHRARLQLRDQLKSLFQEDLK